MIHNPRGFVATKMPLNIHKLTLHLAPVEIQFETPAESKAPLPSSMKAGRPHAAPLIPQSETAPPRLQILSVPEQGNVCSAAAVLSLQRASKIHS